MTAPAPERWRLYGRVWMVVQSAEGPDAVLRLGEAAERHFGYLVRYEDVRVVPVANTTEAHLQIRLPVLHREFASFEAAHTYATEHGLTDCVIVRKDSHFDAELATYGKVPLEPFVISPA